MMGPKDSPTALVPKRWITKRKVTMPRTIGMMGILGLTLIRPSTAETMVMEGVIIPSASRVQPPIMAKR